MRKSRPQKERLPSVAEYMQRVRKSLGKYGELATYDVLADHFGVTSSTITQWMRGFPPSREQAVKSADHAKMPRAEFLPGCGYWPLEEDLKWDRKHYGEKSIDPIGVLRRFGEAAWVYEPLLGTVPGGFPDGRDGMSFVREGSPRHARLRVAGNSMHPEFPDGTQLKVVYSSDARPKDYVVARIGEEVCFKQFDMEDGVIVLRPVNGEYPKRVIRQDEEDFEIQWVVCGVELSIPEHKEVRAQLRELEELRRAG